MTDFKNFIKEKKWKKLKKDQWLILFLAGILLLVIALPSSCGDSSDGKKDQGQTKQAETVTDTSSDYEQELEQRLEQALSRMDGVGNVQVMITFKDSGEAIVEKDVSFSSDVQNQEETDGTMTEKTLNESNEETVYASDSDDGEPFVSKQNVPSIEGVLVIAEGGGNTKVAANISEAVQALFGLEAHKIKVVKMNYVQEGSD